MFVIKDSGYTLEPFMLTAFLNPPLESPGENYNKHHGRARNSVEGALVC